MIKLQTIAIACLAASGLAGRAMALENTSTSSFPTPSSSSSSSVSAPRTGLYTAVTHGNAAADNTVDDYTRRPTLIGDKQYFAGYGDADMQSGAFAFEGMGFNWFGAMAGGADPDELRVGLGKSTAWGGGVIVSFDKQNVETAAAKTKTVLVGDGFGAFGDFNLGSSDVYGQVALYTGFAALNPPNAAFNYVKVEPKAAGGVTTENSNYLIDVMAGWKKDATTEHTHAFNVELAYDMSKHKVDPSTPTEEVTENDLTLNVSHGYILKQSADYSVFLGCNGAFLFVTQKVTNPSTDLSHYGAMASPNLAFQKLFGYGFEGFSGASATLSFDTYDNIAPPFLAPGATSASQLLTGGADVNVGLRWVKDNFALEGSLKETVLQNGPYLIGGTADQGLFANVGIALGI